MSFANPNIIVHVRGEDADLPTEWITVLTSRERAAYTVLARAAYGDLSDTHLKSLARFSQLTPTMLQKCMISLRDYGLISFSDD